MRKWPSLLSGLTKADHCKCDAVRILELGSTSASSYAAPVGAPVGLVGAVRLIAVVFIGSLRPGLVCLLMQLQICARSVL